MILVIPWQKFPYPTFQRKEHWGSGWWDFATNLGLEDGNSPLSLAFASIHAKHEGPPRRWVKPNLHEWREQSSLFTASHSIFTFYHMLSPRHLATLQSPKTSPKVPFSQAGHIRTTPQPLSWLCRGPSLPAAPSLRPGGPVSVVQWLETSRIIRDSPSILFFTSTHFMTKMRRLTVWHLPPFSFHLSPSWASWVLPGTKSERCDEKPVHRVMR